MRKLFVVAVALLTVPAFASTPSVGTVTVKGTVLPYVAITQAATITLNGGSDIVPGDPVNGAVNLLANANVNATLTVDASGLAPWLTAGIANTTDSSIAGAPAPTVRMYANGMGPGGAPAVNQVIAASVHADALPWTVAPVIVDGVPTVRGFGSFTVTITGDN